MSYSLIPSFVLPYFSSLTSLFHYFSSYSLCLAMSICVALLILHLNLYISQFVYLILLSSFSLSGILSFPAHLDSLPHCIFTFLSLICAFLFTKSCNSSINDKDSCCSLFQFSTFHSLSPSPLPRALVSCRESLWTHRGRYCQSLQNLFPPGAVRNKNLTLINLMLCYALPPLSR